jgi:hypothetical protein
VEGDIRTAATALQQPAMKTPPNPADAPTAPPKAAGGFAQAINTLADILQNGTRIAVARITLTGFDTHGNQQPTQARLLGELADGLALLKSRLQAQGRWDDTLVLSYAEFGRRPRENGNRGTDHGTANSHFLLGGRVKGGLYGQTAPLAGLTDGNLPYAIDFRQLYSTVVQDWWGKDAASLFGQRFDRLPLLRAKPAAPAFACARPGANDRQRQFDLHHHTCSPQAHHGHTKRRCRQLTGQASAHTDDGFAAAAVRLTRDEAGITAGPKSQGRVKGPGQMPRPGLMHD